MKQPAPVNRTLLLLQIPITLIGIILFFYFSEYILQFFSAYWLLFLISVIMIFLPRNRVQLSTTISSEARPVRASAFRLLANIILLQIFSYGSLLGICFINNRFLINTEAHANLFSQTVKMELIHFGLFPWPIIALIASGLAIVAYQEKRNAFFGELLNRLFSISETHPVYLAITIGMKRAALLSIAVLLLFFSLSLLNCFLPIQNFIAHGFQTPALLLTLILLLLSSANILKHRVGYFFSRRVPTLFGFFACAALFGILLFLLSAAILHATGNTPTPPVPQFIQTWIAFPWIVSWKIFTTLWWLALIPAMTISIARLAKGFRVREIIIAVLIFPILCALFISCPALIAKIPAIPDLAINIFSTICFALLLSFLVNHLTSGDIATACLPKNGEYKSRDHYPFFYKIIKMTLLCAFFYLSVGINGLSAFLFVLIYLLMFGVFVLFSI